LGSITQSYAKVHSTACTSCAFEPGYTKKLVILDKLL